MNDPTPDHWAPDDEPLWAALLGALLAPGLFFRDAMHAWVATIVSERRGADVTPHLADRDVRLDSPVADLQGHWAAYPAQFLSFLFGIVLWVMATPAGSPLWLLVYAGLNAGVCIGDPVWGLMADIRRRTGQSSNTTKTNR